MMVRRTSSRCTTASCRARSWARCATPSRRRRPFGLSMAIQRQASSLTMFRWMTLRRRAPISSESLPNSWSHWHRSRSPAYLVGRAVGHSRSLVSNGGHTRGKAAVEVISCTTTWMRPDSPPCRPGRSPGTPWCHACSTCRARRTCPRRWSRTRGWPPALRPRARGSVRRLGTDFCSSTVVFCMASCRRAPARQVGKTAKLRIGSH
mmetsp:Transcript_55915/g.158582  ORF Transcript_55915/g.158582 Transcript_55915/m.158582 type:complete len:206 (-) Transcript_55915:609-1226(-)